MKQCKLFIAILLAMLCLLACAADKPTVYTSGDYKYILLEDGTAEITQYTGQEETLTVPDELDGYRVTGIGDRAFYSCTVPKSITLPDSVTSIGNYAFSFCDSLTSITLPDSMTSIGNYAFYYCISLKSITLPDSVTCIGDYAFSSCESLTSITLPNSVTHIGANPFPSCEKLTAIHVSPRHPVLATIDGVLFDKTEKKLICCPCAFTASTYAVPNGILSIGDSAFSSCDSLTSITLPDSLTSIGDWAFCNCTSLTSITLPDNVTSIGNYAFTYCRVLTSITLPDSLTSIGTDAFTDCPRTPHLYRPHGLLRRAMVHRQQYELHLPGCQRLAAELIPLFFAGQSDLSCFFRCAVSTAAPCCRAKFPPLWRRPKGFPVALWKPSVPSGWREGLLSPLSRLRRQLSQRASQGDAAGATCLNDE